MALKEGRNLPGGSERLSPSDAAYMRQAIREAAKGQWKTSPNPCVGAIVVNHGEIVGRGYHHRAGEPHAEVNALAAAGEKAVGATLYVTLEPCNHVGRTPPCTQAILRAGIRRVVIGMADPNPKVVGGGAAFLATKGLSVTQGVMAAECEELNRPFIKHVATGLPWVILKAGMSLDGRLAVASGRSAWITNEKARAVVHRIRSQVDAILVGGGTALTDDPSLTARPRRGGRDPLRVVLDSELRLAPTARMLRQDSTAATWVFCRETVSDARCQALQAAGAVIHRVASGPDGRLDLSLVLRELGRAGVTSVLVEGGGNVFTSFLRHGLADEACFFIAPVLLGADGVPVVGETGFTRVDEAWRLRDVVTRRHGDNVMIRGRLGKPDFPGRLC